MTYRRQEAWPTVLSMVTGRAIRAEKFISNLIKCNKAI